jgi:hypothetical protein
VSDFLTVHIHRNDHRKRRIYYPGRSGNCILLGAYTNNPHVLVRFDSSGFNDKFLSLVLSQYKKSNDLNYSLSLFCTEAFTVSRPAKELAHTKEISSAWTREKCGGPLGSRTSHRNPQFSLEIPHGGATIQVRVSTLRSIAVNVLILPVASYGEGVHEATGKPVIDTGKYRHGFSASDRHQLLAGAFVVLVTSFTAGQTGPLDLKISSSSKVKVKEIN